jgi:hypothetical protein
LGRGYDPDRRAKTDNDDTEFLAMPIQATCACGLTTLAPDSLAGKQAKCPKCSALVDVPALSPALAKLLVRCRCGALLELETTDDRPTVFCISCQSDVGEPGSFVPYSDFVQRVHLIDASMPFGSMCWLVFKWSCAAIPTAMIFGVVIALVMVVFRQIAK